MHSLNPLHYLEQSCLEQDSQKAKWALKIVDKDIQKNICDRLGATTIDDACADLTRLFQATTSVIQQHFDALTEEDKEKVSNHINRFTSIRNFEHLEPNSPEEKITLLTAALYASNVFQDKISPMKFKTNNHLLETLQEIPSARDIFLFAFAKNGNALQFASEDLKKDKEFVLAAISQSGMALEFASDELKNDPEVVCAAIATNSKALQFAGDALKNDPAFILGIIDKSPLVIAFVGPTLKDNREFILHAASINGDILRYISEEYKMDIEIAQTAISQQPEVINYANPLTLTNPDFLISIISKNGLALKYASEKIKNDITVVLSAICQNAEAVTYAGDTLKEDKNFLLDTIEKFPNVFPYLNNELQYDRSFVLEAVKKNGLVLRYVKSIFKEDLEVVMLALSNCGNALQYTTEQIQDNPEIVFFAVCKNGNAIQFANSRFKKDKEFIFKVFEKNPLLFKQAKTAIDIDICLEFIFNSINSSATEENKKLATATINELKSYKDTFLQNYLICRILDLSKEELQEVLSSTIFSKAQKENMIVLLLVIYKTDKSYNGKLELLLKKHYRTLFKDYLKRNPLMKLLESFYYNSTIRDEIKYERLIDIMDQEEGISLISCIQLLNILVKYEIKFMLLKKEDLLLKNLMHIFINDFQRNGIIPSGANPHETQIIEEKAGKIFISLRNPQAFFVYGLIALDNEEIKPSICRFAKGLIDNTFYEDRHNANFHNRFLSFDQKRIWERALEPQQVTTDSSDLRFDRQAFLQECLVTNRRGGDIFNNVVLQLQQIKDIEKSNELESLTLGILTTKHLQHQLQKLYLALNQPQYDGIPFKEDVKNAIALLQKSAPVHGIIVDTEDPEDLFLCGTEITGSCQRIDGNISLNKCLMGYVLDGKIRLIAVKNKDGVIIARAIIKILITQEEKPALFLEWVYGDTRFTKAITDFAKTKASRLQIPLFVEKGDTILSSFGNIAPYEFVDANMDLTSDGITDGKYFIRAKLT